MSGKFGVFNPLKKWKSGDLPLDPTVNIVLNEIFKTNEGDICLTSSLATDDEIDFAIKELKRNLDSVAKQAKQTLKKQCEKIRS